MLLCVGNTKINRNVSKDLIENSNDNIRTYKLCALKENS